MIEVRSGIVVVWPERAWRRLAMPAPLRLRLDQGTREAVAERYEQACTPIERTNGQVVLLADEGRTVTEIAWLVRRGRDQVRKILHRFRSEGLAGVGAGQAHRATTRGDPSLADRIAAGDRL